MMCIVKRSQASVKGDGLAVVDINTLGFCGTLAVKNQASLDFLKQETPIALLRQVAAA
jgi:ATP adenylyltransferase/5',5'''-P-1,P-4-tetraphosphate phosphorylase II